jgi:hypothetical protein
MPYRAMNYLRRKEQFKDKTAANQETVRITRTFDVIIAFIKPVQDLLRN